MDPEYDLGRLRRAQRVDRFVEMVEAAEEGEAFTITDDGKPVAVLIGVAEYDRLVGEVRRLSG